MSSLENINFDELCKIHLEYYNLGYMGPSLSNKLACIALTCYLTNEFRKQGKKITCYDVLIKIGKHSHLDENNTFLKSLGAICESFMYSCDEFPNLGIEVKEMPKQLKILLDKYLPF